MARYFEDLEVVAKSFQVWCFFDEKIWVDGPSAEPKLRKNYQKS